MAVVVVIVFLVIPLIIMFSVQSANRYPRDTGDLRHRLYLAAWDEGMNPGFMALGLGGKGIAVDASRRLVYIGDEVRWCCLAFHEIKALEPVDSEREFGNASHIESGLVIRTHDLRWPVVKIDFGAARGTRDRAFDYLFAAAGLEYT